MQLNIKVCTDDSCKIIVVDNTEVGGSGYLPESSSVTVLNRFKYSETMSIDVLQYNRIDNPEIQVPVYSPHESQSKGVILPVNFDGWFSVYHIVLPTEAWFLSEKEKETGSSLPLYQVVYYSDGTNIFKYLNGEIQATTLEEVIERNTEGTTISKIDKNYVSICFLKKCYISLCQQIFNSRGFSKCWNKNSLENDLVYRRDLVWMTINVIKYMTQFNQLAEAQRIIERIGGCNGLCKSEFKQLTNHGCGCGK